MGKTVYANALARSLLITAGIASSTFSSGALSAPSGETLVNSKCTACHAPKADGQLDRISDSRRTPEGWDMTVARMGYAHGVKLTREERGAIVKYLSDNYGLAPEETEHYRYIIDRTPSVVEHAENQLVFDTCARCHSYGRIAVQRRTEDDWRKLVHFHLGQFPAIEIQAGGRDRNWFEIATGDVARTLGNIYSYESAAWSKWKAMKAADASGQWRVVGRKPGRGDYQGEARIERSGDDRYRIEMTLHYADGKTETSSGNAIVYTGHEWRGTVQQGGREINQIFNLLDGGKALTGRWFETDNDAIGGTLRAVRMGDAPAVLSITPTAVRAGSSGRLTVNGVGLGGDVDLGGVKVTKVVKRSADQVVVDYVAPASLGTGEVAVKIGGTSAPMPLATYARIDHVKVTPEHPMARVGGNGGSMPKVPAQLEAVAFANGPDGKPDTDDDVRLGVMPAKWSVANLNPVAAKMRDTEFAGHITQDGLFVPNGAGPNPKRKFGTNNAGELKVTATVRDGDRDVSGSAALIVTVQRFNDPPIR
ncbi:quinohemoprotein amine dehydrogenase subunit alpha [Nitrogeniibacter mangrovi]|uniref:Quinohemoprotein amine dehydrogenase subunit alpha n=1 Tax=Nitrogeniibacter mangrovi TaxID=2016596 RepID=A0A6C1AYH5_9RHOO|nr:quinohemoprotein amine dehydrogenase subunit alpha [Nitrogeniibacter mangrovi]QID16173.1 quinohemoprotein amine dehydrogenase subunit alpha [Nitrogeniibacter mangrovi]